MSFIHISEADKYLAQLEAETKPLWGTMNAATMVAHLVQSLRMSNGKLTMVCANPEEKLPRLKKFLMSEDAFPENVESKVKVAHIDDEDFYEWVDLFDDELDAFYDFFEHDAYATPVNPMFGPLDFDEWMIFHQKHISHHLKQFGLLK